LEERHAKLQADIKRLEKIMAEVRSVEQWLKKAEPHFQKMSIPSGDKTAVETELNDVNNLLGEGESVKENVLEVARVTKDLL
ncbi:hypothetical protein GN156_36035, partial [bacterium LRH843]|nr:hypothetical protein [bacterium LRH843]